MVSKNTFIILAKEDFLTLQQQNGLFNYFFLRPLNNP